MRRIILVLVIALALTAFAAAQAEGHTLDVPIDGAFHYASNDPDGGSIRFYFDVVEPMNITVVLSLELRCHVTIFKGDYWDYVKNFDTSFSGSPGDPRTASVNLFLNPGRYRVQVDPRDSSNGRAGVRLIPVPTRITELEPNDDIAQATPIKTGEIVYAGFGQPKDTDYFKVDIAQAGEYTLEIEGYMSSLDYACYNSDQLLIDRESINIAGTNKKPMTEKKVLSLPVGIAYIQLDSSISRQPSDGAFYTIKLNAPPIGTSFSLPQGQKVTLGFKSNLTVNTKPKGASLPRLAWKSANPAIATVDENGVVKGHKTGKVKITCTDPASGKSASGIVSVRQNRFSRSNPVIPSKERDLYSSTKKLYYQGDYLMAEIFLVNKTEYLLYIEDDISARVSQMDDAGGQVVHTRILDVWEMPRFMIRPGARKVIKVRFPAGSVPRMDLALGTCEAYVGGFARASTGKKFEIKSVYPEDKKL